jgi:hypothetical protein
MIGCDGNGKNEKRKCILLLLMRNLENLCLYDRYAWGHVGCGKIWGVMFVLGVVDENQNLYESVRIREQQTKR